MSFKTEKANVKANLRAGNYKEKIDPFVGFFDELTYGLKKRDEEKRQEEILKRKEKREEAKALAKKQATEEKKAQDQDKLANLYLTTKGQDKTPENKAAVLSVVKDGNISNYNDLVTIMDKTSTYTVGTSPGDINDQMKAVGLLQSGDGPFQAKTEEVANLSTSGKIEFGKSRGKSVLEMDIGEVRFELSDPSLTSERKSLLERRLSSLTDPTSYEPTPMFHEDGRKTTARTLKEEEQLRADGFTIIEGAEPKDFAKRTLYKDGAKIEILSQDDLELYTGDGWSPIEPAKPEAFVKRTVYNEAGDQQEVTSQIELDNAITAGFSAIKKAAVKDFQKRTLYKEGAEIEILSQEMLETYEADNWSPVKPATTVPFVKRTLYSEDGREQVVTSQEDMNKAIADGFTAIKQAPTEKYVQRTYYLNGDSLVIRSEEDQLKAEAEGWSPIKLGSVSQVINEMNFDDTPENRKLASQIVNKTIKTTTDRYGRPMLVDISSGQDTLIGKSESDQDASSRIVNETLTQEDIANRDTVEAEALAILKEAGFVGTIDELRDVASAFGPEGWIGKVSNTVSGVFNKTAMPSSAEAASTLNTLRTVTTLQIVTAFPGIRDSVQLKESIKALIPQTGKFFRSKPEALRNFTDIKTLLDQAIINQEATANASNVNTTAVSKANVALNALRPLSKIYETLVTSMKSGEKSDSVTNSVFKKVTPDTEIKTINTQEEYDALPVGAKYKYLGKTYTKRKE